MSGRHTVARAGARPLLDLGNAPDPTTRGVYPVEQSGRVAVLAQELDIASFTPESCAKTRVVHIRARSSQKVPVEDDDPHATGRLLFVGGRFPERSQTADGGARTFPG